MRQTLARSLSVLGHPALWLPLAVTGAALLRGAPRALVLQAAVAAAAVALLVGLYSVVQARRGRWQHVDASVPGERRQLHRFLLPALLAAAAATWFLAAAPTVAGGLLASACIAAVAQGTQRWLKLSLHSAFAAFAASLFWPHWIAVAAAAVFALAVAWSRLQLQRHRPAEVAWGLLLGASCGAGFNLALCLLAKG